MSLSLKYLNYQRKQPCIISGGCGAPHHMARIGSGRKRILPHWEHFTTVSLKGIYHIELHTIGDKAFEKKYNVNLWKTALLNLAKWLFERMG